MAETMPNLLEAAGSFERLSGEERERVLGAIAEAQRALLKIPGAEATFEKRGAEDSDFLIALAERVGDAGFEAVLLDSNLDQETRDAFRSKAAAEGGIVSLLKSKLEPTPLFSTASTVCCVSAGVVVVGGVIIAIDGGLSGDVPLALFAATLAGAGAGAMVLCC